jgi:biopolymer transport protein ExbD
MSKNISQLIQDMGQHRKKGQMSIRMTPMIDIIFLLLTFFVLTANFRVPEDFLAISLPGDSTIESFGVIEPLEVSISAYETGCVVEMGGSRVVMADGAFEEGLLVFVEKFSAVLSAQKRKAIDPVDLSFGDDVKWDRLVKIYNVLQAMGVSDVSFTVNGE